MGKRSGKKERNKKIRKKENLKAGLKKERQFKKKVQGSVRNNNNMHTRCRYIFVVVASSSRKEGREKKVLSSPSERNSKFGGKN